jgi:UDP-N-acetyl-D-glucosamine dehydrogenase
MQSLLSKIKSRDAKVAVVGIGYVGLPLCTEIARAGFRVTGYDKDERKTKAVAAKKSYIKDISDAVLAEHVDSGKLTASTDPAVLGEADVIVICVPTPLNKTKDPDNSFIVAAADDITPRLKNGKLIILESTTFPGFTREVLLPKFSEGGLEVGKDFYLAFSPERVDPGNPTYHTKNTPKVIGGTTPACLEVARAMYGEVMDRIVPVSSTDAAEMVKLLENTFRAVNIGLVNEIAIMAGKLGLDTFEIIEAAATKPFGFMPFFPGPGLGGHCIPVDPLYLSWKMKTMKYNARFIELADQVNSGMPGFVVERVRDALNDRERSLKGAKVLVSGVSYKRDIDDMRESPAIDVIELLEQRGAHVVYHDPYVPRLAVGHEELQSVPLENLGSYDAVVIVTDHRNIDYARMVKESRLVIDTRNATKNLRAGAKHVILL